MVRAATCEEKGQTTWTSEAFKNRPFTVQTKTEANIAALGHLWSWSDISYTWSDDNSEVTAERPCTRAGCQATQRETAPAVRTINPPTRSSEGSVVCTTEPFTNVAFRTQSKKVLTIPRLFEGALWLPKKMKSISEEAFAGSACKTVVVPEGCERIGARAFADCPNLIYAKVPAGVEIAEDAFDESVIIDRAGK